MTTLMQNISWAIPNQKQESDREYDKAGLGLLLSAIKIVVGVDLTVEERKDGTKGPKLLRTWQIIMMSIFICTIATGAVAIATREIFFSHNHSATQKMCSWIITIMPQVAAMVIFFHLVAHAPKYHLHIQKLSELVIHSHGQWYSDRENRGKIRRLFILLMIYEFTCIVVDVLLACYSNFNQMNNHVMSGSIASKPYLKTAAFLGLIQLAVLKLIGAIYKVGFILFCKVLSFAFDAMEELKPRNKGSLALYQRHHRNACRLVKENNSLYSGILFMTLTNDFFYIVINAKVVLGLSMTVPIIITLYAIFNKIAGSLMKCVYASRINLQVISTLQNAVCVQSPADLSRFDEEHGNYLLYVTTLAVDYPAITYGGLFSAKKEIFFTFGGTLLSYILLVKDISLNELI